MLHVVGSTVSLVSILAIVIKMVRSDEGVGLERGADEDAVIEPLGLDELELTLEVRAGKDEDDATVDAVVLDHTVGSIGP